MVSDNYVSDDDSWLRRNDNYDPMSAEYKPTNMDVECVTQEDIQRIKRRENTREYQRQKREQNAGKS